MKKTFFFLFAGMLLLGQSAYAALVWNGKSEQWVQGEGTEASPYLLEKPQHLAYLSQTVANGTDTYEGKFFLQTEDFDMNGSTGYLFTPIGTDESHPFKGHFNGGNKSIENIQITYANNIKNCALFGYVYGSTIQNLTIESISYASTESVSYVAAFVAYMFKGKIVNCINNAEISFNASYVGAIVAKSDSIDLIRCINNANITTSSTDVGGLIGNNNQFSTISNCINKGDITNTSTNCTNTGGLCGIIGNGDVYKSGNQGSISSKGKGNVYNYTVYSNATTGGLIGHYYSGTMDQCYNTGNVSSPTGESNSYTGGLFSYDYARYAGTSMTTQSNKVVSNSYVICDIKGYSVYAIGTGYSTVVTASNCYYVGKLTGTKKTLISGYSTGNCYYINDCGLSTSEGQSLSETLMKSVSFPMSLNNNADELYVYDEENINNGYPILAWQLYGVSLFEINVACDENMGSVNGGGTYKKNETATISASPKEGYVFLGWQDGNTDNPRTFEVTGSKDFTAKFVKMVYTINVNQDCTIEVK